MVRPIRAIVSSANTAATISERLNRESGRPWFAGNSQAIAFTWATCSGGKDRGAPRSRLVLQGEGSLAPPLPPLADSLLGHAQFAGERAAGQVRSIMEEEGQARTLDFDVRGVTTPDELTAGLHVGGGESGEVERGASCHDATPFAGCRNICS